MHEVIVETPWHLLEPLGLGGRVVHAGEVSILGADLEAGADHHQAARLHGKPPRYPCCEIAAVGPAQDGEPLLVELGFDCGEDRLDDGVRPRLSWQRAAGAGQVDVDAPPPGVRGEGGFKRRGHRIVIEAE